MQCFEMFDIIHKAVSTMPAVIRVATEVIGDFAADNVAYCELRTTPRDDCVDEHGRRVSRADYVRAIVEVVERSQLHSAGLASPMVVRLLLSIDRSMSLEIAQEVVLLAHKFQDEAVRPSNPSPLDQNVCTNISALGCSCDRVGTVL